MVGSHLNRVLVLYKWLESMNLEDLLVRKNTSNGRETHKVTNDWKERYSRQPFVLQSRTVDANQSEIKIIRSALHPS